jgi:hypothetical protein
MTTHLSIFHRVHLSSQELTAKITMTTAMMQMQMMTVSSKQFGTEAK